MKTKQKKTKTAVSVLVLAGLVVFALTAVGGNLEPSAPPGPTMKTLDEISAQIAALSSPVNKVVRGVINFNWAEPTSKTQEFSLSVDPNKSVVYLSDAVGYVSGNIDETIARNGACLMSLTESEITVAVEPHGQFNQKVSYQIVEYK